MLRDCLPEVVSLQMVDRTLNRDEAISVAEMFSTDAKTLHRMTFSDVQRSAHRFISK
ncbi:MAG: hypothetical protein AAGF48_14120 [Pseudomonadota bacterium]